MAVSDHTFNISDSSKMSLLLSRISNVELTETPTSFIKIIAFVEALLSVSSTDILMSAEACLLVTCIPIKTHLELFPLGHVKTVVGLPELLLISSTQAFLKVFAI